MPVRQLPSPSRFLCALSRVVSLAIPATLAIALVASLPSTASAAEGVAWVESDLEAALEQAAAGETLVMIDVYATWCGPCHMLDRETFPAAEVVALSETLVPLKVDAETPAGEAIVERYNVVAYPTILFIGPDGAEVDRITGFLAARELVELAEGYLAGRGTLAALTAELADKPDDAELRHQVFLRHVMRGNAEEAEAHAEALRTHHRADDSLDEAARADALAEIDFALARYLYLRGEEDWAKALKALEAIVEDYPETSIAKGRVYYPIARAYVGLEREDEAFEVLEKYVASAPDAVGTYNTVAWFAFRQNLRLEWGIEKARAGLEIDPESSALWDTLAELQHASGNSAAAVESIDEAIRLDPDEPYYTMQRERFAAGLEESAARK